MIAIGLLAMLATPGYFILQIWTAAKLTGRWRTAALVPLVLAVPLLVWCAYAFADQSNLWPVPFLLFAPFGTCYLVVLVAASARARCC
jgi:hypothetical protein